MFESYPLIASSIDPRLAESYRYWLAKKALLPDGHLPGRQHIQPNEMAAFLPYVVLFDVERGDGRLRFRHRLTGSNFYHIFGKEVTGMYIEEAGSIEMAAAVGARFTAIVETQQPFFGISPVPVRSREYVHYEHLTMPLARDGKTVDMLFGTRFAVQRPDR
jgi:hypothetical protein